MKDWALALFLAAAALPVAAQNQTATFDFDRGSPALTVGQGIPFDQTAGGVTAHFSSPQGLAFSGQSDSSTGWSMKQFSGQYLYDNNLNVNTLAIKFTQPLTAITLTFATADFNQNETPTTLQMTAYMDADTNPAIGVASAHGTYSNSTMPMGTLTFTAPAGQTFNLVEFTIPYQPLGCSDYFIDNIIVTTTIPSTTYHQTSLVSSIPGYTPLVDYNLVNTWGAARGAGATGGPWWVANAGSGNATLYDSNGNTVSPAVRIPAAQGTGTGSPSGAVALGGRYYFATLDGALAGWTSGGSAVIALNHSGTASFTGITTAQRNGQTLLYVANSLAGVEVYDPRTFKGITLPAGAFTDAAIPAAYKPFGIQAIGSRVYVTYWNGASGGYVDAFDTSGTLLLSLQNGAWMSQPWGIAQAPAGFGKFSQMVLVGNAGSGQIVAFQPKTGKVAGALKDKTGHTLVNPGIKGIGFGNGSMAGPPTTLFLATGFNGTAGMFGRVSPD